MVPINKSKHDGSADLAWWIVCIAALSAVAGLTLFGPLSVRNSNGAPYNPYPEMLGRLARGGIITAKVVSLALVLSIVIGVLMGLGRVSRRRIVRLISSIYVEAIRGIPLLVLLFVSYYGLNQLLPRDWKLGAFTAAVVGLAICYGAYMAEVVRAGIESIPHEELEAAALEGGRWPVLWHITLPRALRTILPAGANELIALLKDSSLISILAISELTRAGQEYASAKFLFFETYVMVALLYLILTLLLSRGVKVLERSWAGTE